MKFPLPAVFLVGSLFVVGCNSLDNPFGGSGILGTGHDGRVFNSQTGQWEWPEGDARRVSSGSRPPGAAPGATPPERQGDGRYFDTQKGQWVEAREERTSSPKPTPKPKTAGPVLMTTPAPVGTPPPVRPPRASGVYNSSTGQIEWRDFDPAPRTTPAKEKKRWYWPF